MITDGQCWELQALVEIDLHVDRDRPGVVVDGPVTDLVQHDARADQSQHQPEDAGIEVTGNEEEMKTNRQNTGWIIKKKIVSYS